MSIRNRITKAALDREVLDGDTRLGRRGLFFLPPWGDDGLLEAIHWPGRDNGGRGSAELSAWTDLTPLRIPDFEEPLHLEPVVQGRRYDAGILRLEALVVAARFELDVRFGYRSGKGEEGVKSVRALSTKSDRLYGGKLDRLGQTPRGAQVPRGALRSYLFDRVQWVELPVDQELQVRWVEGQGYTTDPT